LEVIFYDEPDSTIASSEKNSDAIPVNLHLIAARRRASGMQQYFAFN